VTIIHINEAKGAAKPPIGQSQLGVRRERYATTFAF
jgi:hypothetical protein